MATSQCTAHKQSSQNRTKHNSYLKIIGYKREAMKDKCKIKNLPIPLKKRAKDPSEKPVFNARKLPFV